MMMKRVRTRRVELGLLLLCLLLVAVVAVDKESDIHTERESATMDTSAARHTLDHKPLCSTQDHLEWRIARAIEDIEDTSNGIASPTTVSIPTPYHSSLAGVAEDVVSPQQAHAIVTATAPLFQSRYHRMDKNGHLAAEHFTTLNLRHLREDLKTEAELQLVLQAGEQVRQYIQQQLKLCHLYVDFFSIRRKRLNDIMCTTHADNCHAVLGQETNRTVATCKRDEDGTLVPHTHTGRRMVSSITFLNGLEKGGRVGGGEFFWADPITGEPTRLVSPHPGRTVYFTSGPEHVHGAMPLELKDGGDNNTSRTHDIDNNHDSIGRVTLAIWFRMKPEEAFGENECIKSGWCDADGIPIF